MQGGGGRHTTDGWHSNNWILRRHVWRPTGPSCHARPLVKCMLGASPAGAESYGTVSSSRGRPQPRQLFSKGWLRGEEAKQIPTEHMASLPREHQGPAAGSRQGNSQQWPPHAEAVGGAGKLWSLGVPPCHSHSDSGGMRYWLGPW